MNTKNLVKRAFTLVELIIVIAIIAILAVTAFLLLTKWLSKARDSSRASDLANIEKSLQISLTDKSSLPKPDSYTLIYASGTSNVIGYQGFFGDGVKDAVGNINSAPKDGDDYFTYYLNADLNKYQLAGFLENTTAYNKNVVNAVDYSTRFVTVKGDRLGLLTDANKSPLQTLGLTGLDLLTGNTSYIAYLDNSNNVSGTGKQLFTYYYNQTKSLLQNKDLAKNDSSLVFYSDMETVSGSKLWDFSQYQNSGTCYNSGTSGNCGTVGPQIVNNAMQFDGIDDYIHLGALSGYDSKNGTLFFKINVNQIINTGNINGRNFYVNYLDNNNRFRIYIKKNLNKLVFFSKKEGINYGDYYTNDLINNNKYYIITLTYNQSQGKFNIYLNNIFQIDYDYFDLSINNHFIGKMFSTSSNRDAFNGLIDEVRIYNRALSDNEIKALYTAN